MKLSRDFKEFIECLNAAEVRYLIIGGYAVAWYGRPRYTKDLDVWVDPELANGQQLVKALETFGFSSLGLTAEDFARPEVIVQLGYAPHRIDLLTSAAGLEFQEAWKDRERVEVDGVTINLVSLRHLLANKRAVGRHQDLADVESLEDG